MISTTLSLANLVPNTIIYKVFIQVWDGSNLGPLTSVIEQLPNPATADFPNPFSQDILTDTPIVTLYVLFEEFYNVGVRKLIIVNNNSDDNSQVFVFWKQTDGENIPNILAGFNYVDSGFTTN